MKTPIFCKSLLTALFVITIAGCKTIVLKENRFLNPQSSQATLKASALGYEISEHMVRRTDGTVAHGVAIKRAGNQLTILFFGGNKFLISTKGEKVINQLSQFGADIYMFDHRGYGLSTGTPTIQLLMNDAVENFDFVRSKVNGPLILHGHSLGSFEAGWVAKHRSIDALVLESTVTQVDDWSRELVPWLLKPFIRFEIKPELRIVNNQDTVEKINIPLLLLVGNKDKLTPAKLSKQLYEAASSPHKTLHVFENANHRNVRSHDQFRQVYQNFIDTVLKRDISISLNL